MERAHRFTVLAVGGSSYISTTADPNVVLKGYQIWEDGRRVLDYYEDPGIPQTSGEDGMIREAAIYQHLGNHPLILRFLGLVELKPGIHSLRLELAPLNNIRSYIKQHPNEPLHVGIRLRMATDAARGLAYLHSKQVQYCDLSCRNLMLFDNFQVKLGDFGAALIEGRDFPETFCEEAQYELPLRGRRFENRPARKRDIFALGSAIYEITTWQRPWQGFGDDEVYAKYDKEEFPTVEGNMIGSIITRCWNEVYDTADQVVKDLEERVEALSVDKQDLILHRARSADGDDAKLSSRFATNM
ncbi:hypothetical protein CEP52_016547 [Fusarium oligoseptatum]|uniref:EKC/KEOPS complex subunit BUD32 n=1 Tax=Fusarium oligoseptatum TaxID=2604345 RepID=A0A428S2U7_9HYPO|nr:hypothetical protein CEP52_016547 [Fusarium oligoseptatum]